MVNVSSVDFRGREKRTRFLSGLYSDLLENGIRYFFPGATLERLRKSVSRDPGRPAVKTDASTTTTTKRNTFEDIDTVMVRLGEGHGVRFEFECYDVGQLYNLAIALEKRDYAPPLFIQFVQGIPGGIAAEADHLLHLVRTAQRLFGNDLEWSVLAAGRHQMAMCTHAALLGGNVRVGLEDSLYIGRGEMAKSNADQVAKICRILRELSLDIATPEQARARLKLKGADRIRL